MARYLPAAVPDGMAYVGIIMRDPGLERTAASHQRRPFGLRLSHLVDPADADVQLNLFRPSLGWFVRFFFILDDTDLSIAFDIDQLHF